MEVVINQKAVSKLMDSEHVQSQLESYAQSVAAQVNRNGKCRRHIVSQRTGKHPNRAKGFGAKYYVIQAPKRFQAYERAHASEIYGQFM